MEDGTRKEALIKHWILDVLGELDVRAPGLAGHFLRSSHERQQVISACIACRSHEPSKADLDILQHRSHDEMLSHFVSRPTTGFRPALRQSTQAYHPRVYYRMLAHLLRRHSPSERKRFSHLRDLDLGMLMRWRSAPISLRTPTVLSLFHDREDVRHFVEARRILIENGIDAERIDDDLRGLNNRRSLPKLIEKWTSDLRLSPSPYCSDVLVPVQTVGELRGLGRYLRSCSASFSFNSLAERSAFLRTIDRDETIGMVHLELEGGEWLICEIVGKANRSHGRTVMESVYNELKGAGFIVCRERGPSVWGKVQRFAGLPYIT